MSHVVKFEGDDGSFMLIETTSTRTPSEIGLVSDDSGIPKAVTRLENALDSVTGAAVALMATVDELQRRSGGVSLDEVSLNLGLSFGVEGGMIVAKGSAQTEASVTLTWRRRDQEPAQ